MNSLHGCTIRGTIKTGILHHENISMAFAMNVEPKWKLITHKFKDMHLLVLALYIIGINVWFHYEMPRINVMHTYDDEIVSFQSNWNQMD